jgi:hypothetical protein
MVASRTRRQQAPCHATGRVQDLIAQIEMPQITRGRCALLGDAAHCERSCPMRSSVALQDAHALTGCLARNPDDIATALSQYSDAKVAAHFFPGSSNHGTFTISAGDKMADRIRKRGCNPLEPLAIDGHQCGALQQSEVELPSKAFAAHSSRRARTKMVCD